MRNILVGRNLLLEFDDTLEANSTVLYRSNYKDFSLYNYYYSNWSVFRDVPLSLFFRGTVFHVPTGKIVLLPFEKFFNLGENPSVDPNVLDFSGFYAEKSDGSMLQVAAYNGELILGSRNTVNPHNSLVLETVDRYKLITPELKDYILNNPDTTFLFEVCTPSNQVVILHEQPHLVYLASRKNVIGSKYSMEPLPEYLNVKSSNWKPINQLGESWNEVYELVKSWKDTEGIVAYNPESNKFVKIKTDWYFNLHKLNDKPESTIVRALLDNSFDDLISVLTVNNSPNINLYTQCYNYLEDSFDNGIKELFNRDKSLLFYPTPKEVALALKERKGNKFLPLYFSVFMKFYRLDKEEKNFYTFRKLYIEALNNNQKEVKNLEKLVKI